MGCVQTLIIRLILACVGIVAALILIELGLRLVPRAQLDLWLEKSTRLQLYRSDPRIGWSLRPDAETIFVTRNDRPIEVETNALGLRDDEHTYKKPPGTFRVLILGDSFAEAKDVELDQSFPYLIEQCLNRRVDLQIEVINGGVSGYGPAEEYLFYISEGIKYDPDLVLLVTYVGNDFSDLDRNDQNRMVRGFGGYRFELSQGILKRTWISWEDPYNENVSNWQLFLRQHSIVYRAFTHPESRIYDQYLKLIGSFRFWSQTPDAAEANSGVSPWYLSMHAPNFPNNPTVSPKLKAVWAVFQAIVGRLRSEVNLDKDQLAVVIIPTEYQAHRAELDEAVEDFEDLYESGFDARWSIDEPNVTILKYLEQQQIPTLDLLPYFRTHDQAGGSSLYFEGSFPQHLNVDGQKLMGDLACDWLIRNESIRLPRP